MSQTMNDDLNVIANSDLEITYLDGDLAVIQKLDDEPNDVGGLTSAELKAKFDQAGLAIQSYLNNTLIPELLAADATEAARSAAEAARETAEAARAAAEAARAAAEQAREDATSGIVAQAAQKAQEAAASAEQAAQVVMGKIPDGSIAKEKLVEDVQNILNRAANCATLGEDGKVVSGQLPSMDFVPAEQKGAANGVATLGADGILSEAQRPTVGGIKSDDGSKTLREILSETAGLTATLLWENAAPTSAFAAQTISLDLSDYNWVLIWINKRMEPAAELTHSFAYLCMVGASNDIACLTPSLEGMPYAFTRFVTVTSTGIAFDACYWKYLNTTSKTYDNGYHIPTRIYGIKL